MRIQAGWNFRKGQVGFVMGEPRGNRAEFSDTGRIKALIEIINYVLVELQPISPMTAYLLALARRNLMEEYSMEPISDAN